MLTEPMTHQLTGRERLRSHTPAFFALGAEQGTGKTWMALDDAEFHYLAGRIDALLIVAPKGVHSNWILREIPAHLEVPWVGEYYVSGMGKRKAARVQRLIESRERNTAVDRLKVLAINVDALITKKGIAAAREFLTRNRSMMVVDESHRIKSPSARRTENAIKLGRLAVMRRIASGTLVAEGPLDVWGQYQFLKRGLLGTTSYRAFVAEYADLLPETSALVQEAMNRARIAAERSGRRVHATVPQIVRRDAEGRPVYRNTAKLGKIIAPHTFRVTKAEALDLPPKIFQTRYFELTPELRRSYNAVKNNLRWERDDGEIDIYTALTVITKLRQATAGFINVDGDAAHLVPPERNPRLALLREVVEDAEGQLIIWAVFREEVAQIAAELRAMGVAAVEYHGGTNDEERNHAVDSFQAGDARAFVATATAGGTGLTLTAASTVIYYSCEYSLTARLQSEDRAHRIGTRWPVVYIDLAAVDTIDQRIAAALQSKQEVVAEIMAEI